MSTHFNAFISYRHHPIDSKIAQTIHRSLERFKIPRAIQKATGVKKIDRIFRDKEELPLSINLSDDITEALIHSDFLIVICTPRLKESSWCRREIEFFIQLHGRDRVLIVLGEGEPDDVVPDILTKDREPLCCDYRMKPQQAKQIELPRLAAAILGCRYDDLRQRQRQYRNRRMAAVFSVALAGALALAGYYFQTSRQIQANYEQSLRNQSQYLANTALDLLRTGDRMTAMELALEAVPSDSNPRPWTPDAEYALGEAVGIYQSGLRSMNSAVLEHNGTVLGCVRARGGKHLLSWDDTNTIYVWETATDNLVRTIAVDAIFQEGMYLYTKSAIKTAGEGKLVVINGDVTCYDYLTGQILWKWQEGNVYTGAVNLEKNLVALVGSDDLWLLDIGSGKVVTHRQQEIGSWMEDAVFSDDGMNLAISVSDDGTYDETYGQKIVTYSILRDKFLSIPLDDYEVRSMCFSSDNRLFAMAEYIGDMLSYNPPQGNLYDDFLVDQARHLYLLGVDTEQEKMLWAKSTTAYKASDHYFLDTMECFDQDGNPVEALAYTAADVAGLVQVDTGDVLCRYQLPSSAVVTQVLGDSFFWITDSGHSCNDSAERDYVIGNPGFPEDLAGGCMGSKEYVYARNSTRILVYTYGADEDYQRFASDPFTHYDTLRFCGDGYFVMRALMDPYAQDIRMRCYDIAGHKLLWEAKDAADILLPILGVTQDGKYLVTEPEYTFENDENYVILYDTATGEAEKVLLTQSDSDHLVQCGILWKNYIVYVTHHSVMDEKTFQSQHTYYLHLMDQQTRQVSTVALDLVAEDYFESVNLLDTNALGKLVLCVEDKNGMTARLIDETTGKTIQLGEAQAAKSLANERLRTAWSADGSRFALTQRDSILVFDAAGKLLHTISTQGRAPDSLFLLPQSNQLMVLYSDASVYRYDMEGNLLGSTEICSDPEKMTLNQVRSWTVTDFGLVVDAGGIATVIDMESWTRYATIPNFLAVDTVNDGFVVNVDLEEGVGKCFYPRYTTQTLAQKASQLLQGHSLTREQMDKYGLSE